MKKIYLTKGQVAFLDDEDAIYLGGFNWYAKEQKNTYYAARDVNNKTVRMHQEVIKLIGLIVPKGMQIDHIDRDGLNNQRYNLRIITHSANCFNTNSILYDNVAGCIGVTWENKYQKWRARITTNYYIIHLGYFDTREEAIIARRAAELKYYGEFK